MCQHIAGTYIPMLTRVLEGGGGYLVIRSQSSRAVSIAGTVQAHRGRLEAGAPPPAPLTAASP